MTLLWNVLFGASRTANPIRPQGMESEKEGSNYFSRWCVGHFALEGTFNNFGRQLSLSQLDGEGWTWDLLKHPTMHSQPVLAIQNYLASHIHSSNNEKPWVKGTEIIWWNFSLVTNFAFLCSFDPTWAGYQRHAHEKSFKIMWLP